MEEDDATNARLDAIIGGEEELAVQPPVLLSVLSIDALEALCYAAYKLWRSNDYSDPTPQSLKIIFQQSPNSLPVDSSAARIPLPGATIL